LIVLRRPADAVTVNLAKPLLTELKSLQASVRTHAVKHVRFTVDVGNAGHSTTTHHVTLKT
jgi:hypothetical protein